jgi:hypothetical protein
VIQGSGTEEGGTIKKTQGCTLVVLHIFDSACIPLRDSVLLWGPEGPMIVGAQPVAPVCKHLAELARARRDA